MLQRKFQTSASVTRLPGKADTGKEIALQGNLLHVRPPRCRAQLEPGRKRAALPGRRTVTRACAC